MNLDDVLRDRLAVVKAQRDRARGAPDRAKEHSASNPNRSAVDRALQPHGEGELHSWLGALPESLLAAIATLEVDDRQVRTQGGNDLLEKAILASHNAPSQCSQTGTRLNGAPEEIRTPDPQIRRRACFIEGPSDSCKPALAAEYESQRVVSVLQTQTNRNAPARMAVRRGFLTLARRP